MGGAELLGHVALELDRVDGHHVPRARSLGALHRVDSDAADADHDHRVADLGAPDLRDRTPSGRDAAAEERRALQGMSSSTFTSDAWLTVMYGEKVPSRHIWVRPTSPCVTRWVLSEMESPVNNPAPSSQMFCAPREHGPQTPQAGMKAVTTWSPSANRVTPGPTLTTTPAPS